jgi:hypothetical protein
MVRTRLRIQSLRRIDAEQVRQLLVPLDHLIERRIGDLGHARPIRGLVIPNLLAELLQLCFRRRPTTHPPNLARINPFKKGTVPFLKGLIVVFWGDVVTMLGR